MSGLEILEIMAFTLLTFLALDRFLPLPGFWKFPLYLLSASWNG
jgi:hypothetical protein